MKTRYIMTAVFCLIFFTSVNSIALIQQNPKEKNNIEGIWQGTLKFANIELRVIFNINKNENGSFTATLDSPDQGAKGIPVSRVVFQNDSLIMDVEAVRGNYQGVLQDKGATIAGTWTQSGMDLPLELKRVEKAPTLNRPQEPKKPYPYNEEEVVFRNKAADIKLAGTLTTPKEGGPFPAVVLISGSGPQNRDEEIFGHRPFLVLADYLTRRGIAVLRVDDRGVGGSEGNIAQSTSEDFAGDVLAAIDFLKHHKDIDVGKIGLIGHSEGGIIAPMVAAQSDDVAFIVLMAGTGLTGEEVLYLQAALIARANGADEESINKNRMRQEKLFSVVKQESDSLAAARKIREILKESLADTTEGKDKESENRDAQIDAQVKQLLSKWFKFFLTYDPKIALKEVHCPVLALFGEKDLQVPPRENLNAIEQTLLEEGKTDYVVKVLPHLNHLFQTAETGSPSEYAKIEETISPNALKLIGDWILDQTKNK